MQPVLQEIYSMVHVAYLFCKARCSLVCRVSAMKNSLILAFAP